MFIYVMDENSKRTLEELGYSLIKYNENKSIWVFENKNDIFANIEVPCVVSDILTF